MFILDYCSSLAPHFKYSFEKKLCQLHVGG
jgi:hypothetical protein